MRSCYRRVEVYSQRYSRLTSSRSPARRNPFEIAGPDSGIPLTLWSAGESVRHLLLSLFRLSTRHQVSGENRQLRQYRLAHLSAASHAIVQWRQPFETNLSMISKVASWSPSRRAARSARIIAWAATRSAGSDSGVAVTPRWNHIHRPLQELFLSP